MSNASARPHVDPFGSGVRIGEADTPAPGGGDDSNSDGAVAGTQRKRPRRTIRNWIAWEHDSDDSFVTEEDLMARAMAEESAGTAPPPSVPTPTPTPAPAQPPAVHRVAIEAGGQANPTPGPCRVEGCARASRLQYRQVRCFPGGEFVWVCCLDCKYNTRDEDGVKVHSAECDAFTELAPSPTAGNPADVLTEPAPAPEEVPAAEPLLKRVAPPPATAPATAAVPAPTPSLMPSQPLAADRAASDDEEDPTPWPCCLMTGCSRPRRVRFRHGRGFPVGAFTWVCCSQCTLGEHDANGVKVHSAKCNALTGLAPSSSAVPTADALADSAPAPSALLPTAHAADARTEPAPAPVAVPTVDLLSRNLAALERRDIENDLRRRGVLAPEPPLALAPAPTPASTPTEAEPQLPTAAHASSRAPVTAAHLPALPATAPLPAPVPAPTGHTLAASRKKGKSSAAGSGASAATAGGGASGASASGTSTGRRRWPHHNRPAPTPSPEPLPHTARPRPSTTRSHVGGGASAAAGASDSARAALARAQSPPAHCATPGCCRPRKEWRVDRATFFGVQVCCEPCGVAPPGAAATPHTRDCNAAEAARLRQQPSDTCATAGCGRPQRVWRVDRSTFADIQVCCTHCGYEGHSWGCNAVEEERQGQPPPALY